MTSRTMSLTPELVARCHRAIEDPGPSPGVNYFTDAGYDEVVETMLSGRRAGEPLWLFAYGSLIWKPEIEHVEEQVARAAGWHRSFCIRIVRWRGTRDQPGLMMGLDRGGACQGLALRLPDGDQREQLGKLFRREMTVTPSTNAPRWLKLTTADGPLTALGFVINRKGRAYSGPLPTKKSPRRWQALAATGARGPTISTTLSRISNRGASTTGICGGFRNSLRPK
jgi:cation transport protein ChaC